MTDPFRIYILWHPDFTKGAAVARRLYHLLGKDVTDPAKVEIGIPVFYRSEAFKNEQPKPIDLSQSQKNTVIVLADPEMKLDQHYVKYLEDLVEQADEAQNPLRILPVAFTWHALSISSKIGATNFVRYYEYEKELADKHLEFRLVHELTRYLYGHDSVTDAMNPNKGKRTTATANARGQISKRPVKIFLSHAKDPHKEDGGEKLAKLFNAFILTELGLNTFFDVLHIPVGEGFRESIEEAIKASTVIAIHSDRYASREWCRREILLAKKHGRPLVVVNAFKKGEDRGFPYMSNVPNLHWYSESMYDVQEVVLSIALLALLETLRAEYQEIYLKELLSRNPHISKQVLTRLNYIPELLSLLKLEPTEDKDLVIYPDPPLGLEETELLQAMNPYIRLATPNQLDLL